MPAPDPRSPVSSTSPLISAPYARSHQLLSGSWRIIVDPLSSGDSSPVAVGVEGAGFYQDRTPTDGLELIEYAFTDDETLQVPGDWNSQRAELSLYEGVVWYRRTFDRPPPGRRAFLYVGAANYRCDVYLNGKLCGRHEGGFTPFNVELTDLLRDGENLLVLKVDNRLSAETVPTHKTDWFNYGGLTRELLLIDTAPTFVRDFKVRLADRERREIEVTATLDGPASPSGIEAEMPELGLRVPLQPVGGEFRACFEAPVELWSPAHPRLYDVLLHHGGETIRERVGFRTVEVSGGEILLNGQPVFLKGIATHEESPLHPGRAQGREDALAILGLAQRLGVNFVRLAHYPHDEAIVRAADELGILIWSEIPVYWSIDWNSAAALATARGQLAAMIARDINRASTIIWSVSNETPMSDDRLAFLSTLVAEARAADPDRLVSSALFGNPGAFLKTYALRLMAQIAGSEEEKEEVRAAARTWLRSQPADAQVPEERWAELTGPLTHLVDDPIGDLLDVVAYNQYLGWYPAGFLARMLPVPEASIRRAELTGMRSIRIEPRQDKPLIVSEFGADAKAGFIGDEDTVFSEAFQLRYYRAQLAMLANSEKLRGLSPWVLKDFRTKLRTHPVYQQFWNRKGLFSDSGEPKQASALLAETYAKEHPLR